jgi:triphosphoribosyl-dephospho-CoA synthase
MRTEFLSIGQCATLACLLEATAVKPGNVHRGADFEDLTFTDLAVSAAAIGPAMEHAATTGIGGAVLGAIQATQRLVGTNTNLGMVLLIAPLAAVPRDRPLAEGVLEALAALTARDARQVYEAIRLARPGGMGRVEEMDVAAGAPSSLIDAMRAAAQRDLVARQYANNFAEVLELVVPWLAQGAREGLSLTANIVHAFVQLLAREPDSLIARKCGEAVARQASARATKALEAGGPRDEAYFIALGDLDFWLRSDGHRRNPGTTADVVTAGLFAALRDELVQPPFR